MLLHASFRHEDELVNHVLVCLFPDVACSMPEDDLMFSEDEELQGLPISQTSPPQVKTPSADGLLSLNRLVSHYPLRYVIQGVDWLLVPSDNGPNLFSGPVKKKNELTLVHVFSLLSPRHCVCAFVISPL